MERESQSDDVPEWEALDLDDSELPYLRPCNRRKIHSPKPIVAGPAAAVQAAMRRRDLEGDGDDFIGGALRGGNDEDFAANPWIFAQEFLRTCGDNGVIRTPLGSIKCGFHCDRVDLVVAIVKSSTRTSLGDWMVTLKDPTGTICATIHRKVLSTGEHGKNISVGSVLILEKVALFAPSRSACYLNITLSNVIKVISKNCGPPLTQIHLTSVRYTTQDCESRKTSNTPNVIELQERNQGIIKNLRKNSESRESAQSKIEMDMNSAQVTRCFSNESYKNIEETDKEPPFIQHLMAEEIVKVVVTENNANKDNSILVDEQQATDVAENVVEATNDREIGTLLGHETNKKPIVSSIMVSDWTEEQLDQLGLFDD